MKKKPHVNPKTSSLADVLIEARKTADKYAKTVSEQADIKKVSEGRGDCPACGGSGFKTLPHVNMCCCHDCGWGGDPIEYMRVAEEMDRTTAVHALLRMMEDWG